MEFDEKIIWILGVILFILIGYLAVLSIDIIISIPQGNAEVIISDKSYFPSYMTIIPMGRGLMLPQNHSASWNISVRFPDDEISSIGVTKSVYNIKNIGDKVTVKYSLGGLSKKKIIEKII